MNTFILQFTSSWTVRHIKIHRILHGRAKIWILFSSDKQYSTNERSEWVKYCFLQKEKKIHILKPPCNFLFIIQTRAFLHKQQCKSGKWRHRHPHTWGYGKYATQVLDIVSYELYEWSFFHQNTLVYITNKLIL